MSYNCARYPSWNQSITLNNGCDSFCKACFCNCFHDSITTKYVVHTIGFDHFDLNGLLCFVIFYDSYIAIGYEIYTISNLNPVLSRDWLGTTNDCN